MYNSTTGNYFLALKYVIDGNLNIIAILADGSKKPLTKWKQYTQIKVELRMMAEWYSNKRRPKGIAIICGITSGNLEVIDFDSPEMFPMWAALIDPDLLKQLVVVQTPKDGRHVYYRCEQIEPGNTKLAMCDSNSQTLIETRSQGGYVLAPGSPNECHPRNKPYLVLQGDLTQVPTITTEERLTLINAARSLNRYVATIKTVKVTDKTKSNTIKTNDDTYEKCTREDRPGDDYNATMLWEEILVEDGWAIDHQTGETVYWTRPTKDVGVSATTGHDGSDNLYIFSSNCAGFEPNQSYNKFSYYAITKHGGDFKEAAKVLSREGYGLSIPDVIVPCFEDQQSPHPQTKEEEILRSIVDDDFSNSGNHKKHMESEISGVVNTKSSKKKRRGYLACDLEDWPDPVWLIKDHIIKDTIGIVYGDSTVGKSFFMLDMSLCIATDKKYQGIHKTTKGTVAYVCSESPAGAKKRIAAWLKEHKQKEWPKAFCLIPHRFNLQEEAEADEIIAISRETLGCDPDMIVIDTVAKNLGACSENAPEGIRAFTDNVEYLRDQTKAAVIVVHHTGKDETKGPRGHSSLKGDYDTSILLKATNGKAGTLVCVDKMKESEYLDPYTLNKKTIHLGVDSEGDDITSLVLVQEETMKTKYRLLKGAVKETFCKIVECKKTGTAFTILEALGWTELPKTTLKDHLKKLIEEELIFKNDDLYTINPEHGEIWDL